MCQNLEKILLWYWLAMQPKEHFRLLECIFKLLLICSLNRPCLRVCFFMSASPSSPPPLYCIRLNMTLTKTTMTEVTNKNMMMTKTTLKKKITMNKITIKIWWYYRFTLNGWVVYHMWNFLNKFFTLIFNLWLSLPLTYYATMLRARWIIICINYTELLAKM